MRPGFEILKEAAALGCWQWHRLGLDAAYAGALSPPISVCCLFLFTATAPAAGGDKGAVVSLESPVVAAKAIKNAAELAGMVEAHLRDAVAICDFIAWLEDEVRTPLWLHTK